MNFVILYKALKYISIFSVFVPFIMSVKRMKTLDIALRVLIFYLFISITSDITSLILANQHKTNYLIRSIYTLLECTCLAFIYYHKFESYKIKNIIKGFYFCFVVLFIYFCFQIGGITQYDNGMSVFEAFFFLIIGQTFIYYLFKNMNLEKLKDDSFFWINSAIIIYFSSNIVLFFFYSYIVKFEISKFYFLNSLHLLSNITFNIMLTYGICKVKAN